MQRMRFLQWVKEEDVLGDLLSLSWLRFLAPLLLLLLYLIFPFFL